ncbi:MAG: iron-containing alcohol dehydrogenase, partial [Cyanobacteria bacterium P01_A01_bin.70]
MTTPTFPTLMVAPAQVRRGAGVLATVGEVIARLGQRPLLIGGDRTLAIAAPFLKPALAGLTASSASYGNDCSETALSQLQAAAQAHAADVVIGVGGGKALDAAKLIAQQRQLPVITVPTSA